MDKWLEYWQQEELQPDVFTDKQGNKHDALLAFWRSHFESLQTGTRVLDIASGAGAIYRCLPEIEKFDAHALDISNDALTRLKADLPSVQTHPKRLASSTFLDIQFDCVVSQFGIEYLGDNGFELVPNLLNIGGKCIFLCHIENGIVAQVTEESLTGLHLLQQTQFLQKARAVACAFHQGEKVKIDPAVQAFMKVEPSIASYCQAIPKGHHTHLYNGVKQLLSHYNNYQHEHVIDWLEGASAQAMENIERLESMRKATLNQNDITRIQSSLAKQNLTITSARPFYLRPEDPPAAWEIIGVKQR